MSVRSRWRQSFSALFPGLSFRPGAVSLPGLTLLGVLSLVGVSLCPAAEDDPSAAKRGPTEAIQKKAPSGPSAAERQARQNSRAEHRDFAGVFYRHVPPAEPKMRLSTEGINRSKVYATYYLGLLKENEGDIAGAVDFYARVLELDTSATGLAARAAFLAGQYGEIAQGRDILEKNLAANPEHPFSHLALADYIGTYLADDK